MLVLSHAFWRSRFAGEPGVVGRELLVNGHRFTVIGVAPEGFQGSQLGVERGLYVPMMMQAIVRPPRAGYSGEMDPDLLRQPRTTAGSRRSAGSCRARAAEQAASSLTSLAAGAAAAAPAGAPKIRMATVPVDVGDARTRAQLRSAATLLLAGRGRRPAAGLRERREPDAVPRRRAPARDRAAPGARRQPLARGAAAAHRERAARLPRRPRRPAADLLDPRRVPRGSTAPGRACPSRSRPPWTSGCSPSRSSSPCWPGSPSASRPGSRPRAGRSSRPSRTSRSSPTSARATSTSGAPWWSRR